MSSLDLQPAPSTSRRSFLKISALAWGGLVLGYYLKSGSKAIGQVEKPATESMEDSFSPSAFLRIAHDGSVTIYAARPEVGQGIKTSLPMVVAEELGVDWKKVTVISAPLDPAFGNQSAGGSTSTPTSYMPLRRVGATARMMLIQAAAKTWGVPESECFAEDGVVHHRDSGKTLTYGELTVAASKLPVPDEKSVQLKDPNEFKLLGSRIGGVDNPKVVTGQSLFGIDQKVPGMLYAVYAKCPVWGGTVVKANVDEIKALPGVKDAFVVEKGSKGLTGLVPGVAIVADSTWAAFSARKKLQVEWNEGAYADSSWSKFMAQAKEMAAGGVGEKTRVDGDAPGALASAAKTVEASYYHSFLSHTNLEPQNCTVSVQGDRVEIWVPSQRPDGALHMAADVLGIPAENIKVNITRIGGGFGRRLSSDCRGCGHLEKGRRPSQAHVDAGGRHAARSLPPGWIQRAEGRPRRSGEAHRVEQPLLPFWIQACGR
jgi:isoquinoline 1-oxidoreductase beta subunit